MCVVCFSLCAQRLQVLSSLQLYLHSKEILANDKKMSAGLAQSSWCARFIFLCMNYVRYITKVVGKVSTAMHTHTLLLYFPTFKTALSDAGLSANPSISFAPMNCLVNERNLAHNSNKKKQIHRKNEAVNVSELHVTFTTDFHFSLPNNILPK